MRKNLLFRLLRSTNYMQEKHFSVKTNYILVIRASNNINLVVNSSNSCLINETVPKRQVFYC